MKSLFKKVEPQVSRAVRQPYVGAWTGAEAGALKNEEAGPSLGQNGTLRDSQEIYCIELCGTFLHCSTGWLYHTIPCCTI